MITASTPSIYVIEGHEASKSLLFLNGQSLQLAYRKWVIHSGAVQAHQRRGCNRGIDGKIEWECGRYWAEYKEAGHLKGYSHLTYKGTYFG